MCLRWTRELCDNAGDIGKCLEEYKLPEADQVAARAKAIADGADFAALYNPDKELFWLGWSEREATGNLLRPANERNRTTCYYALARGLSQKPTGRPYQGLLWPKRVYRHGVLVRHRF